MQRYTVTVERLYGARQADTARVLAADEDDAGARGVRKLFGARAVWHQDNGLGRDYGQVFEDATSGGESFSASSRTGRARLYVWPGWDR